MPERINTSDQIGSIENSLSMHNYVNIDDGPDNRYYTVWTTLTVEIEKVWRTYD